MSWEQLTASSTAMEVGLGWDQPSDGGEELIMLLEYLFGFLEVIGIIPSRPIPQRCCHLSSKTGFGITVRLLFLYDLPVWLVNYLECYPEKLMLML